MIVLDNCVTFDGVSEELREGSSIIIEDGIIREIGNAGNAPQSADVIDLGGRFVMPGLIDAHFHSYWHDNASLKMPPQLWGMQAKIKLENTLRRGFTTVRDAGGGDISLAIALRSGVIDGPRLFYPGQALSQTGGHGDLRSPEDYQRPSCEHLSCACVASMTRVVDGPDQMRTAVREHLRQGASQIKIHASGNPSLDPNDPRWYSNFIEDEIRVAVEEATRRRTYVMAHAHSNEAAYRCIVNGVRSIEHATALEADSVQELVARNFFAVPTLSPFAVLREMGTSTGRLSIHVEAGHEMGERVLVTLTMLRDAGAQVGFGTDLAGITIDKYQLREFGLRREVCSPLEILRSATSINAKLLQMEGKIGTVSVGAYADLLALDGNPLEDIMVMEQAERYAMIMRDGKVVKNSLAAC